MHSPARVDELRSQPYEQITGPKQQSCRLLRGRELHARPLRRFTDCLGIDRVVLLPLSRTFLHRQADLTKNFMAELRELTAQ
ncbi:hypothetical protein [Bradyrhizobium brasilense]|uniref:hypothetical protein n=1 Tax=Bradyrhizobium brasilense TaxID=1419277 RepID=UPI0035C751F2